MTAPENVRQRPPRTLAQKLGSVVLGFESLVLALGGLVIFGLDATPEGIPSWWGIVGGAILSLLCVATAGMLSKPWAFTIGWILQGVVALAGVLVFAFVIVALVFGAMWAYAVIGGGKIDRQMAQSAGKVN